VEEICNQNESPHKTTGETDEEVQDTSLAFDDNLNCDVNNIEIEEDDNIFIVMVHLVDPHHFIHTLSMVSGCLSGAFAKNCKGNPNSIDKQIFSQYLVRGNPK
jgi:hypothetical protein